MCFVTSVQYIQYPFYGGKILFYQNLRNSYNGRIISWFRNKRGAFELNMNNWCVVNTCTQGPHHGVYLSFTRFKEFLIVGFKDLCL